MSPFKNDLDAAFAGREAEKSRADAAEKENKKLRDEIAALKNPPPPPEFNNNKKIELESTGRDWGPQVRATLVRDNRGMYETTSIGKAIDKKSREDGTTAGIFYLICCLICTAVWTTSIALFFISGGRWIFAAIVPGPLILSIVNASKCAEIAHKSK